jgi:hypothetical protein
MTYTVKAYREIRVKLHALYTSALCGLSDAKNSKGFYPV